MNQAQGLRTEQNGKSYYFIKKSMPIKKIEKCIVICLDLSGSMNLTYFIDEKNKSRFLILFEELYQQLVELSKTEENVRLFFIGFNCDVKLFGDLISKKDPVILERNILENISKIREKSRVISSSLCLHTLSESLVEMKKLIDVAQMTVVEQMKRKFRFSHNIFKL